MTMSDLDALFESWWDKQPQWFIELSSSITKDKLRMAWVHGYEQGYIKASQEAAEDAAGASL